MIVNGGQLGYFMTLYAPRMLDKLTATMPHLAPIDQLGLLRDNLALANSGYQPLGPALDLLAALPQDANPVVANSAVDQWRDLYDQLEDKNDKAALAALVRQKWIGRLQSLGFDPRKGETLVDTSLRAELISTLGKMGDPTVLAEARSRFAKLSTDRHALDGPLKTTWLRVVARNATLSDWETI